MSEITFHMATAMVPVSEEMLAEAKNMPSFLELLAMAEQRDREFRALPPEEQARIKAEREAAYDAERCTACGCHPSEHGDG